MEQNTRKLSVGERWSEARPTKTLVFWACVASAVVKRLAPMCVVRFTADPGKDQKLKVVKDTDTWQRGEYVKKQGWATMPGEQEPDGKVADECVKLLMLTSK